MSADNEYLANEVSFSLNAKSLWVIVHDVYSHNFSALASGEDQYINTC